MTETTQHENDLSCIRVDVQLPESLDRLISTIPALTRAVQDNSVRLSQLEEVMHRTLLDSPFRDLIQLLDSIESAKPHFRSESGEVSAMNLLQYLEGLQQEIVAILMRFGVESISVTNIPFDPDIHRAVGVTSVEGQDQLVQSIVACGYKFEGRLLRPADVMVTKNAQKVEVK